jgi:DnaJ-class molecular chaperone
MGMPEYSYVSTVCYGCHSSGAPEDYPQHDVNGFFPIYSGTHNGVWAECATCHTNPTDRSVYDCLGCHTQGTVDPVHLGMPEYSYLSTVCYTCHPSGVIEDYIEHDANFFPIYSGTHIDRWTSCATCHIDPGDKSVYSCLVACHAKNPTDNRHTNPTPVPGYVYDSYECFNCHPTGYIP